MKDYKDPYASESRIYLILLHSSDYFLHGITRIISIAKDCYRYPFARHLLRYRKLHQLPVRYYLAINYFHLERLIEYQPEIDDSYENGKYLEFHHMKKPGSLH